MQTRKLGNLWLEFVTNNYKAQIKRFDNPSQFGINNGKISKLWIQHKTKKHTVINYDRGWDIRLKKSHPKELKDLYNKIIKKYN